MGEKASDHFRLISTQKFVLMLTAPYFTFLVQRPHFFTSLPIFYYKLLDCLFVWRFYCTLCCQKEDEHEINQSSWNFYWWYIRWWVLHVRFRSLAFTNDFIFPASKGTIQVLNKQTKSEIKHSSDSMSSAEGEGKSSDQVYDVFNVINNQKYVEGSS